MNSHELPNKQATCPNCGEKLDGATSVSDTKAFPKAGDIGVCFKCGALLEYEEGFFVHELSEITLIGIKVLDETAYNQLIFIQKSIKEFRKQKETGIVYFDENCHGCIHRVRINQCELDTDDDSPCFRYDHYRPGITLN